MKISNRSAFHRSMYVMGGVLAFAVALGVASRAARAACNPPVPCVGDCTGKNSVTVDNILTMVNIALGNTPLSQCTAGDGNCDGSITVDEILTAVNIALSTCPVTGACGDGKVDAGEDCDVGGVCIGGSNAGTACTADSGCQGNGVCIGGAKEETACADYSACPGGKCVHCVTFGGKAVPGTNKTCAANCTFETEIPSTLGAGSRATLYSELLNGTLDLTLSGTETFVVGKQKNNQIPVRVKADSVKFDPINVGTLACACVRGVAVKTCGGTLYNADGSPATDCTPGYNPAGDAACAGKAPCAFVTGEGNAASGAVGCAAGFPGVDLSFTEDSKGSADPAICDPLSPDFNPPNPAYPVCGDPPVITLSGTGPIGSMVVLNTTAIGQAVGGDCSAAGADFCTDAAPFSQRGQPQTLPSVTGVASGMVTNANQLNGDTICNCKSGAVSCAPADCAGPISIAGTPLSACTVVEGGSMSGLGLAGTFTALSQANTGDIVVTNLQKIQ